jgi:hypothetical protein
MQAGWQATNIHTHFRVVHYFPSGRAYLINLTLASHLSAQVSHSHHNPRLPSGNVWRAMLVVARDQTRVSFE